MILSYLKNYLAILNYFPFSAYSGLLKFDMKMFVNVARLDIGQLCTKSTRRGHPCTLDIFLVYIALIQKQSVIFVLP